MNFLRILINSFSILISDSIKSIGNLFRYLLLFLRSLLRIPCKIIGLFCDDNDRYEHPKCVEIPAEVARRPDPCLYSQIYLAAKGLEVTWNNPDIQITRPDGTSADSTFLEADTDYLVKGTIHNASFDPAIGVSIRSFVRPWGFDFSDRTPVEVDNDGNPAQRIVHIAPWGKAEAVFSWHTPAIEDEKKHFCVTVECFHPHDREPNNNIGQENTDVRKASPGSQLSVVIPFFNRHENLHRFRIVANEYQIPTGDVKFELLQIPGMADLNKTQRKRLATQRTSSAPMQELVDKERLNLAIKDNALLGARTRLSTGRQRGHRYRVFGYHGIEVVQEQNARGQFPLSGGWTVEFPKLHKNGDSWNVNVKPGATEDVEAIIRVSETAQTGTRKTINLVATDHLGGFVGGVTVFFDVEV